MRSKVFKQKIDEGQPLNLTPTEICRFADIGSKIERAALGETEEQPQYTKFELIIDIDDPRPDDPEAVAAALAVSSAAMSGQ